MSQFWELHQNWNQNAGKKRTAVIFRCFRPNKSFSKWLTFYSTILFFFTLSALTYGFSIYCTLTKFKKKKKKLVSFSLSHKQPYAILVWRKENTLVLITENWSHFPPPPPPPFLLSLSLFFFFFFFWQKRGGVFHNHAEMTFNHKFKLQKWKLFEIFAPYNLIHT